MAKFASPNKQAASVMKVLQTTAIKSVGTARNYQQSLKNVSTWLADSKQGSLRELTIEKAIQYLDARSEEVGQKALDMDRQAIQAMMIHVTQKLQENKKLKIVKSEQKQILNSRAYTPAQAEMVSEHQSPKHSIATALAHSAGLRAHELLTLLPANERNADKRDDKPILETKFLGRNGELYTVIGKGGLVREVLIPGKLSEQLEKLRLDESVKVKDRNINYETHYNIGGGKNWSNSFTEASKRAVGWSTGAHGVRHSYAQERMDELKKQGLHYKDALETVSQEMGHFRPSITETYLR